MPSLKEASILLASYAVVDCWPATRKSAETRTVPRMMVSLQVLWSP